MSRVIPQVLMAAVCIAFGFALGRMYPADKGPQPRPSWAGPPIAGMNPSRPGALPTPKGPDTTTPRVATVPTTDPAPQDHEHTTGCNHDMPAPEIGPLPDDVQGPLRDLLTALHDAVRATDSEAMTSAQRKLCDWVGGDAQRALEVLDWFKREEDPSSLNILMAALSMDPRIANEERVVGAFLDIARGDASVARRMEALYFIGQGAKRGPEVERELVALARGDADPSIRVAAVVALRQQIDIDPSVAERFNPEFLMVASQATDPGVRQQALQAVRMRHAGGDLVRNVAAFLRQDEDVAVRITAAEQLGETRAQYRTAAMAALAEGFKNDATEDVRRACILALVRVGRDEALPSLRDLRSVDPRLTQDIDDYIRILESGEKDLEWIFDEKSRLERARYPENSFDAATDH